MIPKSFKNLPKMIQKIVTKMVQNRGLEEAWAALGAHQGVFGLLGGVLGRLGRVLGRLGGVLGPLGGQDPTRTRGRRFLEAPWGRLGLHFGSFWDVFWDEFSILFLPYPLIPQHVVKPKKFYFCSTGEPFEALHVNYF